MEENEEKSTTSEVPQTPSQSEIAEENSGENNSETEVTSDAESV